MQVVLDCNVLVICLSSRSPYHSIYKALVAGIFDLIVSQDIILEYEEIIQLKYGIATAQSFMTLLALLPNVHLVYAFYKWNLISSDADDTKYCDCAVSGKADYIVTEDRHFDVRKKVAYPAIPIISIDDFYTLL